MQRFWVLLFFVLGVAVVTATSPACNLFNDLGDAWANADATSAGAGGNMCAGMGGAGGDGGDGGAGGGDEGAGGDGSGAGGDFGVSAGAGGSFGVSVGAGVGGGDARSNGNGHVARGPRHRGHHGGLGTVQQAGCAAMTPPAAPAWGFPPIPAPVPLPGGAVELTTTRLRFICTAQKIGQGLTGIQFSQACGLAFENWVLWTLQVPPNKMPIKSPARVSKTGGLPGSVIPDYVRDLNVVVHDTGEVFTIPNSFFGEVKAVSGNLALSYSQWQIYGLIDVAQLSPAGSSPLLKHPPPELVFTTTGNTAIPGTTIFQATTWGVAIWQQIVNEVPAVPDDPNPTLCIGSNTPLNEWVYPLTVAVPVYRATATCSTLTSVPPNWVELIPGDPDPPTVD